MIKKIGIGVIALLFTVVVVRATIDGNKGDLMVNQGSGGGYRLLTVCANGTALEASSGATLGWACVSYVTSTFSVPMMSTGTVDAVSVCGTSPAIVGANGIGQVTTGSNASTTCTITFGKAFLNKPSCNIRTETTAQVLSTSTIITPASTTLKISQSSSSQFVSAVFDYACIGR